MDVPRGEWVNVVCEAVIINVIYIVTTPVRFVVYVGLGDVHSIHFIVQRNKELAIYLHVTISGILIVTSSYTRPNLRDVNMFIRVSD